MVAATIAALLLAGCTEGPVIAEADDMDTGEAEAQPVAVPLALDEAAIVEHSETITVQPQDACVPTGCGEYVVTQDDEPAFIKIIDFTQHLPPGTQGRVTITATYQADATDTLDVLGNWRLEWWSRDLRATHTLQDNAQGAASIEGIVANHGPDPAEAILIILEPDGGAQPTEVDVQITVEPIVDAFHATHFVAVNLKPTASGIHVETSDGTTAYWVVRGPDREPIHAGAIPSGSFIQFPENAAGGEYFIAHLGDHGAAGRILVLEEELASPLLRGVDTTTEFGRWHDADAGAPGPTTWTVEHAEAPALVSLWFIGDDGRSTTFQASYEVTGPEGDVLLQGSMSCDVCFLSVSRTQTDWAEPGLVAGTYTYTVNVDRAQGWVFADGASLYQDAR